MFLRRRGIANNNAISFGNLLFLAVIDNIIYYIVPIMYICTIIYDFSYTIFEVFETYNACAIQDSILVIVKYCILLLLSFVDFDLILRYPSY